MSLRYNMKFYELTYLISPDLSEEEIKVLQEKVTSLIQEEGILSEVGSSIRKTLAYPIKKKQSAFSTTLSFQISPERLENLEKKLKAESKVLRYLILTKKLPKKIAALPVKKPRKIVRPKPKVELKEIEKKLEEILGES